MPIPDNNTPGVPSETPYQNTASLRFLGVEGERGRSWVQAAFGMILGVLLVGNIFMYSLHQALHARVENQERRLERIDKMVEDLLVTNQNAEKIEKIEQQVDGITTQVLELTEVLRTSVSEEAEEAEEAEKPKRKRQRKKR